jgi:hypothetical protein
VTAVLLLAQFLPPKYNISRPPPCTYVFKHPLTDGSARNGMNGVNWFGTIDRQVVVDPPSIPSGITCRAKQSSSSVSAESCGQLLPRTGELSDPGWQSRYVGSWSSNQAIYARRTLNFNVLRLHENFLDGSLVIRD